MPASSTALGATITELCRSQREAYIRFCQRELCSCDVEHETIVVRRLPLLPGELKKLGDSSPRGEKFLNYENRTYPVLQSHVRAGKFDACLQTCRCGDAFGQGGVVGRVLFRCVDHVTQVLFIAQLKERTRNEFGSSFSRRKKKRSNKESRTRE